MIIGMIAIFAGFSAAALAAWGDSRFLMAAPVATLIGVGAFIGLGVFFFIEWWKGRNDGF